jgi:hypothetical protein
MSTRAANRSSYRLITRPSGMTIRTSIKSGPDSITGVPGAGSPAA